MTDPPATIVIPTRGRPHYLAVALASIAPQAASEGVELVVVDDRDEPATAATAAAHGARRLLTDGGAGANAGRNLGIAASTAELVVLVDDDVFAPAGWLAAILGGATRYPDHDVFGGPIQAALDGGPRSCGREGAPITTLDLGSRDRDASFVWSANMAIRRSALRRIGPFDESLRGRGEEEEWQRRLRAAGGRVRYLAAAGLTHRRTWEDARLRRLSRAQYALGRSARRWDVRKRAAPSRLREATVLAGTIVHIVRFRCPSMATGAAHAAGRLRESLAVASR